jgi:hypothetical protein
VFWSWNVSRFTDPTISQQNTYCSGWWLDLLLNAYILNLFKESWNRVLKRNFQKTPRFNKIQNKQQFWDFSIDFDAPYILDRIYSSMLQEAWNAVKQSS